MADNAQKSPDVLVIEGGPGDDIRRLGRWLTDAGLRLQTVRPYADDPLPADLSGYAALVVLGRQEPAAAGDWSGAAESLLRKAVRYRVPTLAVGLGAQLLATAHGGAVAPASAGPELGPGLVARRDVAGADPLFDQVPFTPDVICWHHHEVTELPVGAVLLAASPRYPHQAFRVGQVAWGLQFHIEPDPDLVAEWATADAGALADLQRDPAQVAAAAAAVMADLAEVWQPVAARFAALVRGELAATPPDLPLLGR